MKKRIISMLLVLVLTFGFVCILASCGGGETECSHVDSDGNELLLSDVLGTETDMVYNDAEENVEKELLKKAIKKLSAREQQIVSLRFGLDGKEEVTQKEVADLLGISQSYISRLEKKIIARLRGNVAEKF